MTRPLSIAVCPSDRVRALAEGRVGIDGCDATVMVLEVEELMFRASRFPEFDVCELAFGAYLAMLERGDCPYVGLPVFPGRAFRHGCFYVRRGSGIEGPEDLAGRSIGVPDWTLTTAIWARGLLTEEYGVPLDAVTWRIGGLEQPGRTSRVPTSPPPGVRIEPIPVDATLSRMLLSGDVDAIVASRPPSCFGNGAGPASRLIADWAQEERAYFGRSGIFPIQHLVVMRHALAEAEPRLAAAVTAAFEEAKALALAELRQADPLPYALPWLEASVAETEAAFGPDFWPYGIEPNQRTLETLCRYAASQGITSDALSVESLFWPP